MSDIKCPYCKEGVNINHDDGNGYSESETHHQACNHCKLTFAFTTSIIFSYDAFSAHCIDNEDKPHKYDDLGYCNCGKRNPHYNRELKHG